MNAYKYLNSLIEPSRRKSVVTSTEAFKYVLVVERQIGLVIHHGPPLPYGGVVGPVGHTRLRVRISKWTQSCSVYF